MAMARDKGTSTQTQEILGGDRTGRSTGRSRELGRAMEEVGEVHSTEEAG